MFFDNDFRLSAPFITVISTFIIFILLICLIRLFISPYVLMIVYDNCNFLNYQYQYVVRLLFVGISSTYEPERTTITVRIDHSIRRCRDIPFTPEIMNQSTIYNGLHCAKIFIRTVERYQDIKCVTIFHNGMGSILIDSIELQNVDQPNSIIATVQFPIGDENFMQKIRSFPFGREKLTYIENDIRPTNNVTFLETNYFIYTSLNIIYSLNAFTFMVKCSISDCRLPTIIILSLISCAITFAIFIILILPFRFIIKVYYHNRMGRGFCKLLRFIYLLIILLIGLMTAGFACELSTKKEFYKINESNQLQFHADIFWLITTGISVFLYFCIIGITIPIAIFINYIELPSKDRNWRQQLQDKCSSLLLMQKNNKYIVNKHKNKQLFSYRSDEAKSLLTNRLNDDDDTNNSTTTSITNKSETETDSYYNMLIKLRKNEIKSISTFIKPNLRSVIVGGGGGGGFRRQQQQRKKSITDMKNIRITKQKSKIDLKRKKQLNQQQQRNVDSLNQFSSDGEDYYQLMLKHQKVRSVSQYKK